MRPTSNLAGSLTLDVWRTGMTNFLQNQSPVCKYVVDLERSMKCQDKSSRNGEVFSNLCFAPNEVKTIEEDILKLSNAMLLDTKTGKNVNL